MRLEMFLLIKFVSVVGFVVAVVVVDVVITDFVAAVVVWEVFGVVDVVAVVVASDVAVIDTLVLCSHFWCCRRCNISLKLLLLRSSLLSFLLLKLLPTFFSTTKRTMKQNPILYSISVKQFARWYVNFIVRWNLPSSRTIFFFLPPQKKIFFRSL